ncbi:MAG: histidine kinase dimerization/phospho-acceptor domain-containing protein, partial [Ktedonobacteraceae bacterium]
MSSLSQIYLAQSVQHLQSLTALAASGDVSSVLRHEASTHNNLTTLLIHDLVDKRLASLALMNADRSTLVQVGESVPSTGGELWHAGLLGHEGSELVQQGSVWDLALEVPVQAATGQVMGVLLAVQHLDAYFASDLAVNGGLRVALCQNQQLLGSSDDAMTHTLLSAGTAFCLPGTDQMREGEQNYLTLCATVKAAAQLPDSPQLELIDVEPLYDFNAHSERVWQILLGIGIFVIALGVTVSTSITRIFFIHPLRQLQSYVEELAPNLLDSSPPADELRRLTHSLNLLSESLTTRENESHEITKQMSDLLTMGDILLSTLSLEHLLGEIVSRLGPIMYARGVVLHLYGRETSSPWAVAQWRDPDEPFAVLTANGTGSIGRNATNVHIDPAGDATLAMTTKMSAITAPVRRPVSSNASGQRRALRAPRLMAPPVYTPRRSLIPQPALRELDVTLARMTMQKHKIVYAEDIAAIYHERGEGWAQSALEAGYCSVIAVPMLLQEQAIGAFILYNDKTVSVTQSDTFLLTTAAIQIGMAIQNALLFAEVKDKNAALERISHLKSQFLATVTHELRTPLHSIISYGALILEGFLEGELTSEQEEHIQFMVNRAEDLSGLVDDMLDLSKIEADRLEIKVEPLHLEKGLQEVISQLKPMAQNKGLSLTLDMEDSLPLALADSQRVRQVMLNLVSNALKFTETGGVSIR